MQEKIDHVRAYRWMPCSFFRRSIAILVVTAATFLSIGTWNSVRAATLDPEIGAADALELKELIDRWRELTAEVTIPFSRSGIEVLAREIAAIYALPTDVRDKSLAVLRGGDLVVLLPAGEFHKYCAETERVAELVAGGATETLAVKLPAEVVHAAPALAALQSVLGGLLDELDHLTDTDEALVLDHLRQKLTGFVELQQARAALELLDAVSETQPGVTGADMLRRVLDRVGSIEQTKRLLPSTALPELKLCRSEGDGWPSLPRLDPQAVELWGRLEREFEDFATSTEGQLQSILDEAAEKVADFPPMKEFFDPVLETVRSTEELARWRVGYEYTPSFDTNRGQIDLVAINDPLRMTVPLGITIKRVSRTVSVDGRVVLSFEGDAFLQSGSVDTAVLQSALAALGLPTWARLTATELSVEDDLNAISLLARIRIDALGLEIEQPIVLHDASRVVDLEGDMKGLVDRLADELAARLRSATPRLSTSWGAVDLVVGSVTAEKIVMNEPWQLVVAGTTLVPFGVQGTVEVVLALREDRRQPFRLISATASPDLERRFIEQLNGILDDVLVALGSTPYEARPYLTGCLALKSISFRAGREAAVDLTVDIDAGGAAHAIDVELADWEAFGKRLLETAGSNVLECIAKQIAVYSARTALGLTATEIEEYLASLRQTRFSLWGVDFAAMAVEPPAGMRGIIFELVGEAAGAQVRFGHLELLVEAWRPGQPLPASAIDFSAATISPEDVRRLMLEVTDLPEQILQDVGVQMDGGVLIVSPLIRIDIFGGDIAIPAIRLQPGMTETEVRRSVLTAANDFVEQMLVERVGELLPDIGDVQSVSVDDGSTTLLPVDGKNAQIGLKIKTNLEYFSISWTVTIAIRSDGSSTLSLDAGAIEEQLTDQLLGFLGDALKGIAPGGVENVAVITSAPYGVGFDVAADIGGFKATIPGVKVTTDGVQLGSTLKLEYRQPPGVPIPPAFQALPVDISIDLRQLANFEIGAFITFASDDWGVIGLDARLRGEGGGKRLATEGVLKILHGLPLVKSTGVVDFGERSIVMRTQTVGELSKLLDIGDRITITADPMQAEMAARLNVLGIEAEGHMRIAVDGKQAKVSLGGVADLLLGKAEVNAVLDSRLRGTGVSGTIDTFVGLARLDVSTGSAQAELDVHGFRIKLIVPSVRQLTPELLEEALRRLFDFELSWDSIKNREIVISLVDPDGRTNTDPVGGDPGGGSPTGDASAKTPGDLPATTTDPGGGGDAVSNGSAPSGCGLPNSSMVGSEVTFPGHVVEMTGPESNTYYYYATSRVAPATAWEAIKTLPQIACFTFHDLSMPYFSPDGFDIRSPLVQVFVDGAGQLMVMAWRKDQTPQTLSLDGEQWAVILDGADPIEAFRLATEGLTVKGFARRVLRILVAQMIDANLSERLVDSVRVVPSTIDGTGLVGERGVISLVQRPDGLVLRIFAGSADEFGSSPDLEESDSLFALLQTPEQRRGPLGQLLVAATVAGVKLRAHHIQEDCTLVTADAVDEGAWEGRIFAVTSSAVLPAVIVSEGRTLDTLQEAAGGDLVCAALLGSDGNPRWEALSGGIIDRAIALFALGRQIEGPEWSIRFVSPLAPDALRESSREPIETKLRAWSADGLVVDRQLGSVPLDAPAVLRLLDTLVLPETGYLDRLRVNPRGLL